MRHRPRRMDRRGALKLAGGFLLGLTTPAWTRRSEGVRHVSSNESIQQAVDRAPPGSTILVAPGTYLETVIIDKPLKLVSQGGYRATVIQADRSKFAWRGRTRSDYIVGAINVTRTEDVLIDGFTLLDALEGLWVSASRRVLIRGCMSCGHQSSGYYFWASQNATLMNSEASQNAVGVYQGASVSISIIGNLMRRNHGGRVPHLDNVAYPGIGILVGNSSTGCQIAGNTCRNNLDWGIGISMGITDVAIVHNEARANRVGLFVGTRGVSANNNNFAGNREYGLQSAVATNARHNWWGDASGPSGAGPGHGDAVTPEVLYDPWLRTPEDIAKPEFTLEL
ncbi:MAG TPA: NosD domain-containing protein [Trueperaceae bacterium]